MNPSGMWLHTGGVGNDSSIASVPNPMTRDALDPHYTRGGERFTSMRRNRTAWLAVVPLIVTIAVCAVALRPTTANAAGVPWSDSLAEYGMPTNADNYWQPPNWDTQVHERNMENTGDYMDSHNADHGADCSSPPATHVVNKWNQSLFICHNHLMTAMADEGYGEEAITPDRMADWSGGAVTIGWSVSTLHQADRDWYAIDVTPFTDQLSLPFDEGGVDLQGMPHHYIEVRLDNCNGDDMFRIVREDAGGDSFGHEQDVSDCLQASGITPSAVTRTPFELVVSTTGWIFRIGAGSAQAPGKVLSSGNWNIPLTFTRGVVQFVHHSYNAAKDGGIPSTWHWSDFSISNAVQYTLLRPTDHQVITGNGQFSTFAQAAPAGSYLKFAGIGTIQVSYDNGAHYHTPLKPWMAADLFHDEHFTNYLDPVPAGTTKALFKVAGGWFGNGMARDFSIVSETLAGNPPPTPTSTSTPVPPTPTNTPIPPTPTPTQVPPTPTPVPPTPTPPGPTPTPAPTPIPIDNVPCTVTLNGVQQTGTCSGTFNPNSGGGATPTPTPNPSPTPSPTPIPPTPTPSPTPPPAGAAPHLTVVSNALVSVETGQPIRLHGVNMDGADYACVQGFGMTDYPANQTTINHLKALGFNAVRLPMNEDCWLGNSGGAQYGGAAYRSFMASWIHLLESNGITPIPEIQMDSTLTGRTQPGPDTALFWTSFTQYMGPTDTRMIFDTFNEPHNTTWAQWKGYQQPLVNAIRNAGGQQVIALEGLQWAQDMTGWLANRPTDPMNREMASFHGYGGGCTQACWSSQIAPIAAQYPIYAGEFGYWGSTNSMSQALMTFLDQYPSTAATAWTYNAWPKDEAMVVDWTSYGLKPWGTAVVAAFAASKH